MAFLVLGVSMDKMWQLEDNVNLDCHCDPPLGLLKHISRYFKMAPGAMPAGLCLISYTSLYALFYYSAF